MAPSYGKMSKPNSIKICPAVPKLKHADRQAGRRNQPYVRSFSSRRIKKASNADIKIFTFIYTQYSVVKLGLP